MIRALIVDDEPLARENIILRLDEQAEFDVCGQADNGHDAVLLASKLKPDVIFLDIEMPGLKGIDAARELSSRSNALIIFVTAFEEYAVEAFQVEALDYLQKPINDNIFAKTLERIKRHVENDVKNEEPSTLLEQNGDFLKRLGIKDANDIHMIDVNSVEVIEVAGDYLCITASKKNYIHRQPLSTLLELLDPELFVRIHRSHAINIDYLQTLNDEAEGPISIMKNGRRLNVSRRYQKSLRDKIKS